MNEWASLRRRFPLLERKTYLNSGSYGALADTVRDAVGAYLADRLSEGACWGAWTAKLEAVRAAMAQVLRASPDEVAVTASASAGINALASALEFTGARTKVVISDLEFPTHAQIWHAQAPRGAEVVQVPCAPDGSVPLEHFERAIDERTRLVAVTHVCYRNGARLDIPGIARLAHARGVPVLLDAYQAVGALAVEPRRLGVDFVAGGMGKYLLGTAGIGFLYVRAEHIPALVPTQSGWFAQEDIAAMDAGANRPARSARRFEAGTPPVVNCHAAEAGLAIILEASVSRIEDRVRALTRRCLDGLTEIGWPAVTPNDDERRGPLVAVPARDAAGLVERLAGQGIVTSCRDGNVRASCHFYNNEADIDRFLGALKIHRAEFQPR